MCVRVCVRVCVCKREEGERGEWSDPTPALLLACLSLTPLPNALLSALPCRKIPVAFYHPVNDNLILLALTQVGKETAEICPNIETLLLANEKAARMGV